MHVCKKHSLILNAVDKPLQAKNCYSFMHDLHYALHKGTSFLYRACTGVHTSVVTHIDPEISTQKMIKDSTPPAAPC